MRSKSSAALVIALSIGGCAFSDGSPWSTTTLDMTVALGTEGREEGDRLKNVSGVTFELDEFGVTVDDIELQLAGEGDAAFDPANPPDGFSLCHNGHCHADDGRLVEYAEISAESSDGEEITFSVAAPVDLLDGSFNHTTETIDLPRGDGRTISVRISQIDVSGLAFGDGLPDQGAPFAMTLNPPSPVVATIERTFGVDADEHFKPSILVEVPAGVLDGVRVKDGMLSADLEESQRAFEELVKIEIEESSK